MGNQGAISEERKAAGNTGRTDIMEEGVSRQSKQRHAHPVRANAA